MIKFREWFTLEEGLRILQIDPEEDWDHGEAAYQIANKVHIRPDSTKSPTIIAMNDNDEVIGAAFTSWTHDHEATAMANEPIAQWAFDVVVDPAWQGYEMVGMKLIKAAEKARSEYESAYDQKAYTRLWVVNPKLAKVLQHPKYGYERESEYNDGSAHLVKY
jgi:hypothetical protein